VRCRLKEAQQRLSAELERRHEAEQRLQATAAELSGMFPVLFGSTLLQTREAGPFASFVRLCGLRCEIALRWCAACRLGVLCCGASCLRIQADRSNS
jgi:hypothetical protein